MNEQAVTLLAEAYSNAVAVAGRTAVAAEPEAQLTVPVSNLFVGLAEADGLGKLAMIREAQLNGVRPDFAAMIAGRPCGWVELKKPGHTLDGERWTGREASQWELLAELDSLIVTDGRRAVLYNAGQPIGESQLPKDDPDSWDSQPLVEMLRLFAAAAPRPIRSVSQLASRLAPLARFILIRLDQGIGNNVSAVVTAKQVWDTTVHATTASHQFSNDVAQVIAYSMAMAGLSDNPDLDGDGQITLTEAKSVLERSNANVLAAALGPIIGLPGLVDWIGPELAAISRLISCIDLPAITNSQDSRGEPWLWFYEDFLAKFDPQARKQAGVYYTPIPVVKCQVRLVDDLLRNRFGQRNGFGSKSVVTLDPATGSGTYPLAVIDQAVDAAWKEGGKVKAAQIGRNLTENVIAFELLPGPYAVAHLRISQRLAEAQSQLGNLNEVGVYLTDTLENPDITMAPALFGDALVLAQAAQKARTIKAKRQITVAIGNPPYERVERASAGGWIVHRDDEESLFDDIREVAQKAGVIFSAQASLYNLYVYFWLWSIWKVFQNDPQDKAVISFITASSWLEGPGFIGLRKLAVDTASEIWVIDLGGEGRGGRIEENVFDIQTPVAIVTLVRSGKAARPATVRYRRIRGSRDDKFKALDQIDRFDTTDPEWAIVSADHGEPFTPRVGGVWEDYPLLADLFPWQQPGIMYNRTWPIAPSKEILEARWKALLVDPDPDVRAYRFFTAKTGRTIVTRVPGMTALADLPSDAIHEPIVRMGWRSFDQQWTFTDPRLANLERPALWQSLSPKQVFLVSPATARISEGPAVAVSVGVPDKHFFRGSYGGKDVIPLYRDAAATQPNITAGLLDLLAATYGRPITPEDFAAYCYALLAHGGYTSTFSDPLEHSMARVPLTADPHLFGEAVNLGERLLWLHTGTQRFTGPGRPADPRALPHHGEFNWTSDLEELPADKNAIRYDPDTQELQFGTATIPHITPEIREYQVSGMNVLDKWLGARTKKGIGRAAGAKATPLDRIRPTEWDPDWTDELTDLLRILASTLDLAPRQQELLDAVCAGPLIDADQLPVPTKAERTVPKTIKHASSTADDLLNGQTAG